MEVYAPLAHRLGIRSWSRRSWRILPCASWTRLPITEIEIPLILRKDERDKFLSMHPGTAYRSGSMPTGMHFYLESRVKSIYGIYRKVYMQGRDFDEIYDVYAVRVIVDTVNECYNVLGIMHDMFRPIPNRFKDYISTPKANMYQSLHTTVHRQGGHPL